MAPTTARVVYFASAKAFAAWLAKHHDREREIMVGFYKKGSGREGLTYREALDVALAYGWIDGVRRRVDDASYTNRFSPRQANSVWSAVNRKRVEELIVAGRMKPPGLAAYERRSDRKRGRYSYEERPTGFEPALEKIFRSHKKAWAFFEAQPPGYRRTAIWYVVSAARDETQRRRLTTLIELCATGRRLALTTGTKTQSPSPH